MYATCLFCNRALGRNDSIEAFPVGRRLAFDLAKGRLWVICPSCARWNLSPIETRWEAIEEAEGAYRDARLRTSSENVGLAKLKDGTDLVRVGSPLLPEFAAWRYGGIFKRRFWKSNAIEISASVGSIATSAFVAMGQGSSLPLMLGLTGAALAGQSVYSFRKFHRAHVPRLLVRDGAGQQLRLSAWDASRTEMAAQTDDSWTLRIAHRIIDPAGPVLSALGKKSLVRFAFSYREVSGIAARSALATMLPTVNVGGGGANEISDAVTALSNQRSLADSFLNRDDRDGSTTTKSTPTPLGRLPGRYRLALEMSLHEEDERRALQGEMALLEARWKEAEAIAAIADEMFLPVDIEEQLAAMRQKGIDRT